MMTLVKGATLALLVLQARAFVLQSKTGVSRINTAVYDASLISTFGGVDSIPQEQLIAGGAALLAAIAGGAVLSSSASSDNTGVSAPSSMVATPEPEPEPPVDLSIPYDAAARMAYAEFMTAKGMTEFDETSYLKFKKIYEEKSIAEAIAKKAARDLAAL